MSQGREERLWREFTESKSETAREALILEYAPLVKYVPAGLPLVYRLMWNLMIWSVAEYLA